MLMAGAAVAAICLALVFCLALGLWPKVAVALLVTGTVVAQTLQTMTGSSLAGYVDELAVFAAIMVFPLRRLLIHKSLRCIHAYWFFAAYAIIGMTSAVLNSVPPNIWLLSGFLFLKGPLLLLGILQIDWRRDDIPKIVRFSTVALLVVLLSALINAMAPEAWNWVVGRQPVSYRLGIPSLTGIFDHPVGLGSTMGLAFLAILSYRRVVERSLVSLVLLIATAAVGILTFRRKSVASVLIVAVGTRLALPGLKAKSILLLSLVIPIALIAAWEPLTQVVTSTYEEYFTNIDSTARTTMTIDSVTLAAAAFPLGVGLGRFGSAVAASNYSPLYDELGYTRVYGMGPGERGGFLTDTFWPSVLAESGFLGLLFYLAGLIMLVYPAWQLMRRSPHPHVQWIGTVVVAWMGQMLIESIAAPVFTGPPMFGPVFALAGVAAAIHLRESSLGHPLRGQAVEEMPPWSDGSPLHGTALWRAHGRRRYQESP